MDDAQFRAIRVGDGATFLLAVLRLDTAATFAQVAANTTAEQTLAVVGLVAGDVVVVNKPTAQAGLGIVGARVSAADTIAITFVNATGAGITPTAAETYRILVFRTGTAQ